MGAAGQDTDFCKSPEKLIGITDGPFYGCSYKPMLLVVLGGTRTNIDLQALDANDEPIPGLFNVGTMIGDFYIPACIPSHFRALAPSKSACNPPAKSARTNSGPQGQSQRHKAPPGQMSRTGPCAHTGVVTAPFYPLFTPQQRCGRRRSRS